MYGAHDDTDPHSLAHNARVAARDAFKATHTDRWQIRDGIGEIIGDLATSELIEPVTDTEGYGAVVVTGGWCTAYRWANPDVPAREVYPNPLREGIQRPGLAERLDLIVELLGAAGEFVDTPHASPTDAEKARYKQVKEILEGALDAVADIRDAHLAQAVQQ